MTCSQCGYANRVPMGQCARCGAPLVAAPPPSSLPLGDDRTTVRPTHLQDAGPIPAQPEVSSVWPGYDAYPEVGDPVPAPPDPARAGTGWGSPASRWGTSPDAGRGAQPPLPAPMAPMVPAGFASGVQRPMATVGSRFAAHLLDGLVVTGLLLALYVVALVLGLFASSLSRISYDLASLAAAAVGLVALVAYLGVGIGYIVWGWGTGQTFGKRAMKIAVVDAATGAPIGYSRAVVRYLMMAVMALPCYLGYFSILAADGRGWHDKAADSRVVVAPNWPALALPWKR